MKEVQLKLAADYGVKLPGDLDARLTEIVWDRYFSAKDAGYFRLRRWFFTIDISPQVAGLLVRWFGVDPLERPI